MADEFSFIRWIQSQQSKSAGVLVPAGDDMAVMNWPPGDLLLCAVDQVIDGVHFDSRQRSPRQIGRKVVNRNLSDCAAMACLPAAALACVALPRGCGEKYARELYLGMREAADVFSCPIVGGDTGSWDGKLVLSVTIMGKSAGIAPVLRSGARAGDFLYVSGPLGGSIISRHMDFRPKIALARELASKYRISAMIDISDGLSRDLGHICHESKVGAAINAPMIPIHFDAMALSKTDAISALDHALNDGEDHELLLCSADEIPGLFQIGQMTADPAIVIRRAGRTFPLTPAGWEHQL